MCTACIRVLSAISVLCEVQFVYCVYKSMCTVYIRILGAICALCT